MNEKDLVQIVNSMEATSVSRSGTFIADNKKAFEYYMGEPFGNEEENRSQVVTTDVADVVESDMPSLARVFLGSSDVVEFEPVSEAEQDLEEARQKNIYIPYLIDNCRNSFKKQHDFLKSIEIYKAGVLEYGMETIRKVDNKRFKGMSGPEMTLQLEEFKNDEDITKFEVVSRDITKITTEVGEEERFDIEVYLVYEREQFFISNVPIEDLILSRDAQTKDDADIVGKRWRKTRGELVEEGFDKETVKNLPRTDSTENQQLKDDRQNVVGGDNSGQRLTASNTQLHWTQEMVAGVDVYVLVDYDEDGIRERRHVIKSGSTVLENEVFNHVPYVICSAIQIPHNLIGRSRADTVMTTQEIQSVLSRGVLDNVYMTNAGRNIVSDQVNTDDLLAVRHNGIIRYRGKEPITNHVLPLVTPYMGDKTLQVIQYFDSRRAQTTGSLLANQGLESDDLHKETATRFRGVEDASKAKIELLARVIAECGYIDLYEGAAWYVKYFQDDEKEIRVLGQTYTVNPADWKNENKVAAKVGTGAGDDEKALQNNSALLAVLEQLKARGSLLVDEKKIYNVIKDITRIMGRKDVSTVLNDPEIPQQMLLAQNEQLTVMVQQLQQMLEMSVQQNPLAEAEQVKAVKEIELKRQTLENQNRQFVLKLSEDARQFNAQLAADKDKESDQTAVKLTELELEYDTNVPGAVT